MSREQDAAPRDGGVAEDTLLRLAAAGDERAFDLLFERQAPALRGKIRRVLPAAVTRKVSVADVLQEVRITAYARLAEFEPRGEGAFRRWLLRIAEHKIQDTLKGLTRAKRDVRVELTRGRRPETHDVHAAAPSPSAVAAAAEQSRHVRAVLDELAPDHREILLLVFEHDLTLGEAAEVMGRSREAAKKLYGRALAAFTRALERSREDRHDR